MKEKKEKEEKARPPRKGDFKMRLQSEIWNKPLCHSPIFW